jgi:hypothetical protein
MASSFSYKTLIYEPDQAVSSRLAGLLRRLGMEPFEAATLQAAEAVIRDKFLELALVNIHAPVIGLKPDTRRIVMGHSNVLAAEILLYYQPEAIISYPLHEPLAVFHLCQVSGILPLVPSFPGDLIELLAIVQEYLFRIESLLALEAGRTDLAASAVRYCREQCVFARPSSELTSEEVKASEAIGASLGHGHLMCSYKPTCMLHRLSAYLKEHDPQLSALTPASALDHMMPPEGSLGISMVIKKAYEYYDGWANRLLEARKDICLKMCHAPDPQGGAGTLVKTKCNGFGCVLDNYFDIVPDKKYLHASKVLIYEDDEKDAKILEFLCREFKMEPMVLTSPAEVERLLSRGKWDFAIVNPELDKVVIPKRTKVIIVDKLSVGIIARILTYRPVAVITKPFDVPTLSRGFIRALGLPFGQGTMPAALNNMAMAFQSLETALNNWMIDERRRFDIKQSVKYFCESRCPSATLRAGIPDGDMVQYHPLDLYSKRGALYCKAKPACKLWGFLDRSLEGNMQSVDSILRASRDVVPGQSVFSFLLAVQADIKHHVDALDRQRLAYCTQVCDRHKDDMSAAKGDTLFSSLDDVIKRNSFSYCKEQDCPTMLFFEYFRRKLI